MIKVYWTFIKLHNWVKVSKCYGEITGRLDKKLVEVKVTLEYLNFNYCILNVYNYIRIVHFIYCKSKCIVWISRTTFFAPWTGEMSVHFFHRPTLKVWWVNTTTGNNIARPAHTVYWNFPLGLQWLLARYYAAWAWEELETMNPHFKLEMSVKCIFLSLWAHTLSCLFTGSFTLRTETFQGSLFLFILAKLGISIKQ